MEKIIDRVFTDGKIPVKTTVEWGKREAFIQDPRDNRTIFKQTDVEYPTSWSQQAVNIVSQKYFRGPMDDKVEGTYDPEKRERSAWDMITRVSHTISNWGNDAGYFNSAPAEHAFKDELTYILLHQIACFNSPVWFNVGVKKKPQCSACFLNSVEDSMESILDLARTEGMLFKGGSGTGTNLSKLRGSTERLSGGGTSSGPISFMRGFDSFAGAIKSGGTTRRAAKMVILDVDHPDILDFIDTKVLEEKKACALIDAGFDGNFNVPGGAYDSVSFQNANHSVRVTDEFMQAVEDDGEWKTFRRTDGAMEGLHSAREIMRRAAEAAHTCGDPGIQFHTTINDWHTSSASGPITMSNPCSEYMYLDDTACNLASINLLKFWDWEERQFDFEKFEHTCKVMITAMEIIVGSASYPTKKIGRNSELYRPLGLGYTNLGALLMAMGLPYNSDAARETAAAITSLMSAAAYDQSATMAASDIGPFDKYLENQESFHKVMNMHLDASMALTARMKRTPLPVGILKTAERAEILWVDNVSATASGAAGMRNGQISVLAPTGTISFFMDCDTTGVEPELALVKYKKLVGGGIIKIVNNSVTKVLEGLGYSSDEVEAAKAFILEKGGIPEEIIKPEDLSIFDCSFPDSTTGRSITWEGHVDMMAAVQPFISGAISKTVNMPSNTTIEQIEQVYRYAWKRGLKAVAVYRDGCKRTQPLSSSSDEINNIKNIETEAVWGSIKGRRKLPDTRPSVTHKFSIGGHDGYITAGFYPDSGRIGEVFMVAAKEGSTVGGLIDAFATCLSIALQYGVPPEHLIEKLKGMRFEPAGFTTNKDIPNAKSIIDYLMRWLEIQSNIKQDSPLELIDINTLILANGNSSIDKTPIVEYYGDGIHPESVTFNIDAPTCNQCGTLMTIAGRCHRCPNCGTGGACD